MGSVWNELKRRNVVRVAIAYAVVAWLLLQVADVILNNIETSRWATSVRVSPGWSVRLPNGLPGLAI